MMTPGLFLAWLGGGRAEVLREAPADASKYSAMGAVLLGTAGMAGASASFAVNTAVGLPMAAAVVVGALWGLVILSLDRMLVISMARRAGFWRNLGAAVPRLMLALLIGAVISVPLVLRIFEPEINAQLQVMHSENLIENQKKLDERFADIEPMRAKADQLQATVNGADQKNAADDPDVRAAQKEVDTAQATYDKAYKDAQCELTGKCGSGRIGKGPAYDNAMAALRAADTALKNAQAKLAQVRQAARDRLIGDDTRTKQAAEEELARLRPLLDSRVAERTTAQRLLDDAEQENAGLLARLEALDELSKDRTMMLLAHWALILLFACIELLPVLAKLLSSSGPPTLYEQLTQQREGRALDADRIWLDERQKLAAIRADARTELETHRAALQVEAGKEANARLAAKQREIADRAIDTWGQVAMLRTDEELARWYARHVRAQQPPANSQAGIPTPANGQNSNYHPASTP